MPPSRVAGEYNGHLSMSFGTFLGKNRSINYSLRSAHRHRRWFLIKPQHVRERFIPMPSINVPTPSSFLCNLYMGYYASRNDTVIYYVYSIVAKIIYNNSLSDCMTVFSWVAWRKLFALGANAGIMQMYSKRACPKPITVCGELYNFSRPRRRALRGGDWH